MAAESNLCFFRLISDIKTNPITASEIARKPAKEMFWLKNKKPSRAACNVFVLENKTPILKFFDLKVFNKKTLANT